MKKLIYLTLTTVVLLSACAKKYCWECTTIEGGGGTDTSYATVCDQSEEEIKSRIGTTTSVDTSGSKPISISYTTDCEKQED